MGGLRSALISQRDWLDWLPAPVVAVLILALAMVIALALHHWVRHLIRRFLAERYPFLHSMLHRMRGLTRLALLVTDANESTIEVRATMSANTAGQAGSLCCEVRKEIIDFLQRQHPEALPRQRREELAGTGAPGQLANIGGEPLGTPPASRPTRNNPTRVSAPTLPFTFGHVYGAQGFSSAGR